MAFDESMLKNILLLLLIPFLVDALLCGFYSLCLICFTTNSIYSYFNENEIRINNNDNYTKFIDYIKPKFKQIHYLGTLLYSILSLILSVLICILFYNKLKISPLKLIISNTFLGTLIGAYLNRLGFIRDMLINWETIIKECIEYRSAKEYQYYTTHIIYNIMLLFFLLIWFYLVCYFWSYYDLSMFNINVCAFFIVYLLAIISIYFKTVLSNFYTNKIDKIPLYYNITLSVGPNDTLDASTDKGLGTSTDRSSGNLAERLFTPKMRKEPNDLDDTYYGGHNVVSARKLNFSVESAKTTDDMQTRLGINEEIEDTFCNKYNSPAYINYHDYIKYNTDKKYAQISCLVAPYTSHIGSDSKPQTWRKLMIYADNKVVYGSQEIKDDTQPFQIQINIKLAEYVKFVCISTDTYKGIILDNLLFYRSDKILL